MIKHIQIKDVNIRYKDSGEGECVIFLHGWGCNLDIFQNIHAALEKDFRVITIDFPGFGESTPPPSVWGVYEYTGFLEEFIRELHIENPILVGHSFGGRVSIVYASRNTNLKKIILVDAAGIKPKRSLKYYVKVYSFKCMKHLAKLFLSKEKSEELINSYRKKSGSTDYNNANGIIRRIFVKVVNEDLKAELPKIKVPTLLFWGKADTATPLKDAQIMNKLIPDSGLVAFDNVGHYSFLERPYDFEAVIKNFLTH